MVRSRLVLLGIFLLFCAGIAAAASTFTVSGRVLSGDGVLPEAEVALLTSPDAVPRLTRSGPDGEFRFANVAPGTYLLRVRAVGYSETRMAVSVTGRDPAAVSVRLAVAPVHEEVTVTANPGRVEDAGTISQPVNVISDDQLALRSKAVVAQFAQEEEGLHLQRTSPTVSGVFVRGLTGNKVNVFVDGVRFSTGAARGGINTFLNLVDASVLESVEVLRGPNSAQYGSDALGGSLQFLSVAPPVGLDPARMGGSYSIMGSTADASFGSSLLFTYGSRSYGFVSNVNAKRVNRIRPGGGFDSHSAFTRFLGLPSTAFLESRLPDTAFTQYGGMARLAWTPAAQTHFTFFYDRGQQDGGRRYDQLLGGDGNLVADLRNLMADVFYIRADRQKFGWLDAATFIYSLNSQREERVNQGGNGNPRATISHEYERTTVHGIQGRLDKRIGAQDFLLGAEYYHERLNSPAYSLNPVTGATSLRRPRVPDEARFRSGGIYLQDVYEHGSGRLRLTGSLRYSAASYRARAEDSPIVNGQPLWTDDSLRVDNITFRAGIVGRPTKMLSLFFNASRGFRAPHMTDLGTLGLTGSGFEVAAPDVAGMGATQGTTADRNAVSSGLPVSQVRQETNLTYDVGAHLHSTIFDGSLTVFVNNVDELVTKQSLILPAGAVGKTLGGTVITDQLPNGVVFVAASSNPVLVRGNFDDARLYGVEQRLDVRLGRQWVLGNTFTYVRADDGRTGAPPNLEGGIPAPDGYLRLRYTASNGRWWVEPYVHASARQERLSSLDLEDRRTGGMRSRTSIQNFFYNGATARGLVSAGTDATFGTADDVLLATGETLAQVQARVLGTAQSAPLFSAVAGYVTYSIRGGVQLSERQRISADFENIGDKNYRGISWGVDAPGRNFTLRYAVSF